MEEDMITCKIIATISLISAYIGTILPFLLHAAENATPFLQDGAYIVSIVAGVIAFFKRGKAKK